MKKVIAIALVHLTTVIAAFSDTFYGTITQTITSTNDPLYQVGQTFTGYYSYESSCVDGTFDGFAPWRPDLSANTTLNGSIYRAFAKEVHFEYYVGNTHVMQDYYYSGGSYNALSHTPNHPGTLVVENGCIKDFYWAFENGGMWTWANENEFQALSFYDRGPQSQVPKTRGTVVLGNPVCVPDVVATFPLLAGVLFGLGLLRRRFVG